MIFVHQNLISNRLTNLVHAKSTGELISFGLFSESVVVRYGMRHATDASLSHVGLRTERSLIAIAQSVLQCYDTVGWVI